jgi:hypothetical protein
LDTAIKTFSVESGIPAHGEHLLFEEVGCARIDSFYLEVVMESLSCHQLDASGIHSHLSHFMKSFSDRRDMKASN